VFAIFARTRYRALEVQRGASLLLRPATRRNRPVRFVRRRTRKVPKLSPLPRVEFGLEFCVGGLAVHASRPAWNGYLKLSFVSCPIALYPATVAAERLSFRQVNRRTGQRLKHKLVDAITGEEVASSNKARGYETAPDKFLLVEDRDIERARSGRPLLGGPERGPSRPFRHESPPTAPYEVEGNESADLGDETEDDEEIAPVRPQNTRTIEIEHFVPLGHVDANYFEKPYYIAPRGEISQEAFAVIRDAMAREKVAGIARIVLSSRERPFLLQPMGNGLRGTTLRFAQDVRGEHDFFESIPSIKLAPEMMKLAQHIIRTKAADFDPAMLDDHYRKALGRILRKKQKTTEAPAAPTAPSRENVVSLMDALKRSIAAEHKLKKHPASGRAKAKSRTR
jgi:DNA end-binding protein Ku